MAEEIVLADDFAGQSGRPEGVKKKKNIVVCCDGTGNEFGGSNSNVVKIYTAARIDNDQVGYYHPGVGTMGSPMARGRLGEWWSKVKGLGFGAGFMDHVEDAYRYLMSVYDDGDCIYLFGFSRGAYTARALAAILYSYGLLCRGNEGHIPYMWKLFSDDMAEAAKENKKKGGGKKTSIGIHREFKATFSHCVNLHFVGLWDTVSSVGWITEPVKLLYSAQNPSIQRGRHAVSVDERRCFFVDNLWGPALTRNDARWRDEMRELAAATKDDRFLTLEQDIFQAWFPGVHSDVGGSYCSRESALSNVTLAWMLREAKAAGLETVAEREEMLFGIPEKPKVGEIDRRLPQAGLYEKPAEPWQTQAIHRSLRGAWWLLEVLPHGYYDKDDDGNVKTRIPWGRARTIADGSVIHGTVVGRMRQPGSVYRPVNLLRGELVEHAKERIPGTEFAEFYVYERKARKAGPVRVLAEAAAVAAMGLAVLALRRMRFGEG